jgi:hypothetical protein
MDSVVESTAGQISCRTCGETVALERGQAAMRAKIASFWDAHHHCGRIHIDLGTAEHPSQGA